MKFNSDETYSSITSCCCSIAVIVREEIRLNNEPSMNFDTILLIFDVQYACVRDKKLVGLEYTTEIQ